MMIARHILKLQNLAKTTPFFRFSEFNESESAFNHNENRPQRVQKPRFKKVAIILSGCGVYDGSEVTEAVSLMVHLNKNHVSFQCYAPNQNQMHVVNHITGEVTTETRNVLVESARIARGDVKDITQLKGEDYQAVLLPGGFGAAKNLSDYAVNGANFTVNTEVERALREFHSQKKPIGAMCISPLILAKVLQNEKPKITMGRVDNQDTPNKYWPHSEAINVAEKLGAQHFQRNADKFQVDFENKIVTAPAMMFNGFAKFSTTFDGAGYLVNIIDQIVQGNSIKLETFGEKKQENFDGERRPRGQYNRNNNRRPRENSEHHEQHHQYHEQQ
ncbi:hypothetical protein ABPG72_001517 [Tetrahymena utriculariae]